MNRLWWLLIRLTPIYWLGFVVTTLRYMWAYHRPTVRLPVVLPSLANPRCLAILCVICAGVWVLVFLTQTSHDVEILSTAEIQHMIETELRRQVEESAPSVEVPLIRRNTYDSEDLSPTTKTMSMPVSGFALNGCLNTEKVSHGGSYTRTVVTCPDSDMASMYALVWMPDEWDGESFRVGMFASIEVNPPYGDARFDWRGYCYEGRPGILQPKLPVHNAYGRLLLKMSAHMFGQLVTEQTEGHIPLANCKGKKNRHLYLEMSVDAVYTTFNRMDLLYLTNIQAEYNVVKGTK